MSDLEDIEKTQKQIKTLICNICNLKTISDEVVNKLATEVVTNITSGEPAGSDPVINLVSLTQAEYDAGVIIPTTLYVIKPEE